MSKLRLLFYLAKPYSIPSSQSLREIVNSREDITSLCFISRKLQDFLADETITTKLSDAVAFNPDIVFCPGNYVHDSIGGIKVQLFHGLCYEKRGHFGIRGFFQVYCTSGPIVTQKFQKLAARHKTFIVIETGWPKTDLLFRKSHRPKQLGGIYSNKKIILYAPTFSRKMTSVPKILKTLKQLPRENEFFVIKLHDLHDKQEREILTSLPKEKFLFVDSPDIIPWMQSSDMLISDTSSVVYEYALIKDKILLVEPRRKDLPFTQCSASNIRKAIDDVLHGSCQNREAVRKEMNAVHPYRDGLCAQRILDQVTDPEFIKQVDALPRKRNIFRKLRLRYYDRFKKGYVK